MKLLRNSNNVSNVGFIKDFSLVKIWLRLLMWALQLSDRSYWQLYDRIHHLYSKNGKVFLVLYCKECTRIIQKFVSGHPELVTNQFPIGLKGGLPSIIPGTLRSLIRSGDQVTTRGILSVFALYRIFKIPGVLKLNTITDPFTGLDESVPVYECIRAVNEIGRIKILHKFRLLFLSSAGPNSSVSFLGLWKDLEAWYQQPLLFDKFKRFLTLSNADELLSLMENSRLESQVILNQQFSLGKLSLKEEAAGKIRVFAICDAWTQSAFKPLSDAIFSVLKSLPMDGTFDQDRPVQYLLSLYKDNKIPKGSHFYSYDLSSATDRLPIKLQTQLMSLSFGEEYASLWKSILVERGWSLKGIPYFYSVGQPMGALSSWAMLAYTHHCVVRIAANRVGRPDFANYALLGDDIVIADDAVAMAYHELMTKILGVEINLFKSLVSQHSFEFAKRLVTVTGEVSPVGAKNLLVGVKSLKGLPSILLDLKNKGFSLSEDLVNTMYKSCPTTRKSSLERISWLVKGPFGFVPTEDGLLSHIRISSSLSSIAMDSLLSSIDKAKHVQDLNSWSRNLKKSDEILFKIRSSLGTEELQNNPLFEHIIQRYCDIGVEFADNIPRYRLMFGGPLVMFNYYREGYGLELMKYITSKIKADSKVVMSLMDPFNPDRVLLPLSHSVKAENFWLLVKEIEDEKSSFRGYKGFIS